MSASASRWISTRQMATELGVHRVTLQRLKSAGYFRSGHHYRKANPPGPQVQHRLAPATRPDAHGCRLRQSHTTRSGLIQQILRQTQKSSGCQSDNENQPLSMNF